MVSNDRRSNVRALALDSAVYPLPSPRAELRNFEERTMVGSSGGISQMARIATRFAASLLGLLLVQTVAIAEPEPSQQQPLATVPVIDGRDIACRAAQNWIPATTLRARARTLVQLYCDADECEQQAACALSRFLHMQASHQEDIGAASALRAYYTRIAIAEQMAIASESMQLVDSEEDKQEAIQQGGLPAGTDLTGFERQRIKILDGQLQIGLQDRQLRSLLAQLTGLDYATDQVSQEELDVIPTSLDCPNLQQRALSTRHDIQGWIYISGQVNETSAPIFAKMLPTIVGSWGIPLPAIRLKSLLCPPDHSQLAANMKQELDLIVETHRRWICQAVMEKCSKLEMSYARIELAQQTIQSWRERLKQLEQLKEHGDGKPAESAHARSELLRARVEEIKRRLEARIAEIDLAEATGCLSQRCCDGQAWLLTGFEL